LNRLLLISRICYLYEFTRNDSYLYGDEAIKGIIKSCKGVRLQLIPLFICNLQRESKNALYFTPRVWGAKSQIFVVSKGINPTTCKRLGKGCSII